jgi:hypothetical protein
MTGSSSLNVYIILLYKIYFKSIFYFKIYYNIFFIFHINILKLSKNINLIYFFLKSDTPKQNSKHKLNTLQVDLRDQV